MKLLLTGDWHLRGGKPENRIDDYVDTQDRKVRFILELAKKEKCYSILQPGDMTEHFPYPRMGFGILADYILLFNAYSIPIDTIFGQHDSSYRTDKMNVPLRVMDASNAINIVYHPYIYDGTCLYDCHFGEEIPKIEPETENEFSILLIHRMVSDKDYWAGHVQFTTPLWLMANTKYDLIVSGDNHKSFAYHDNGRWVINCGSLMRSNVDQIDHQPCVYVFDTETRTAEKHDIPVLPAATVFNLEKVEEEKERREESSRYTEALEGSVYSGDLDFPRTLKQLQDEGKDEGVNEIIAEGFRNIKEK